MLTNTLAGLLARLTAKADNSPRKLTTLRPADPPAGRRNRINLPSTCATPEFRHIGSVTISALPPTIIPLHRVGTRATITGGMFLTPRNLGLYASYGRYIGGARLASASIPMDGLRITSANPADWADATRLTDGALELGSGQIIAAATLLAAMDARNRP